MAKDLSTQVWHGIPRKEIPWFPKIDEQLCIGCDLCYVSCGREVFEADDKKRKVLVERPYNCMVGCSTCATICPTNAILFPERDIVQKIEKEHKILKVVRQKANVKKTKKLLEETREQVTKMLNNLAVSVELEITGHLGERKFIPKLYELVSEIPCDIVNLTIETPTLKGCWNEKAPSYAKFQLVSTQFEDITIYIQALKEFFKEENIVLISERKII